jgi:phosphatidylinositol alpha-1,6-mannosyltransferase
LRLHLGFDSLAPGNGGICRVARLIARVVSEEVAAGRVERAAAVVLRDDHPPIDLALPVRVCGGSRTRFVAHCALSKWKTSHAIYDFVGLAAAHTVIPFPYRPFLTYIHGIEVWEGWAKPKYARSADRAAVLVSNSAYTRERASRWHPPLSRAVVCWLGTEEDEAPPEVVPTGPPRVTIIARMEYDRYKGHQELIESWPKIRQTISDAVLTIVGRGPLASHYEELARKHGLGPDVVEFRGFVPDSEIASIWAQTHVFAMPSRGEGFGLVYIEAMRYGRPVVASIHDAAPEVNLDGVTGFNINLDRPGELVERLVCLLRNPELCHRLGSNGRDRWANHFRLSAFRDRFVPILRDFLNH